MNKPVCEIKNVNVNYKIKTTAFKSEVISAVSNASLIVCEGDIYGIVGESGCGKSSLCNAILGFVPISDGEIEVFDKVICSNIKKNNLRKYREKMNVIFQNPFQALNSRFPVWKIISEPLYIKGEKDETILKSKALEMLNAVGLNEDDLNRYVFEFSGGQRQRIAIARALITNSKFIILDEPTSALDVSVQSQICNLLIDLKNKYNLTYLFVSHNLALIYQITNKLAVMYCGQIVEYGDTLEIFNNPKHPYTRGLISSILDGKKDNEKNSFELKGEVSSMLNMKACCRFKDRCPYYSNKCDNDIVMKKINDSHYSTCVLSEN